MSRIGGSDSVEFVALDAVCTRLARLPTLRTLRLADNQIAGIDAVGSGSRLQAGVHLLADMLRSEW